MSALATHRSLSALATHRSLSALATHRSLSTLATLRALGPDLRIGAAGAVDRPVDQEAAEDMRGRPRPRWVRGCVEVRVRVEVRDEEGGRLGQSERLMYGISRAKSPAEGGKLSEPPTTTPVEKLTLEAPVGAAKLLVTSGAPRTRLPALSALKKGCAGPVGAVVASISGGGSEAGCW